MIRNKDLCKWLEEPLTQVFLELVKEHREASYRLITEGMIGSNSLKDLDMYSIAQHKGQVNAFDIILSLEEFMSELVEIKEEGKEDESV